MLSVLRDEQSTVCCRWSACLYEISCNYLQVFSTPNSTVIQKCPLFTCLHAFVSERISPAYTGPFLLGAHPLKSQKKEDILEASGLCLQRAQNCQNSAEGGGGIRKLRIAGQPHFLQTSFNLFSHPSLPLFLLSDSTPNIPSPTAGDSP